MKTIKLLVTLSIICTCSTAWGKSDDWFVKEHYVCFSRNENCEAKIVDLINESKKSIDVFAYLITSKEIANALIAAHERGLDVKLTVEGKENKFFKNSKVKWLKDKGIPVRFVEDEGIFHHKIMIFDEEKMLTGSYNFTWSAQNKNHENVLFLKNTEVIGEYLKKSQF